MKVHSLKIISYTRFSEMYKVTMFQKHLKPLICNRQFKSMAVTYNIMSTYYTYGKLTHRN